MISTYTGLTTPEMEKRVTTNLRIYTARIDIYGIKNIESQMMYA